MSLSQPDSAQVEHIPIHSSETLAAVADRIEQAGMSGPAAVLLHTLKPLAWVGGQLAWMLQPFVDGLTWGGRSPSSPTSISGLARLLESEDGVDKLLERLHGRTTDDGRRTTEKPSSVVRRLSSLLKR